MRFSSILSTLAFAASALAQTPQFASVSSPTKGQKLMAGMPFEFVWQTANHLGGTISIYLLQGPDETHLETTAILAEHVPNEEHGMFKWIVPPALAAEVGVFGINITLDSDPNVFQYSPFFTVASINATGLP
ncbi:hypothetical protein F4809DRAFT_232025 [Biscogniauxia mediterranea]|nr:hypothetical protein F4809DRAFT_232025 [Biscogniauxia mediterranea]